ncbi:MAG: hypothetical protein PF637_11485 [Spirochaetes bacterium]|jgi:hypothetical protein|nr:hypothetical protein [Spirochaetota bacterium]
MIIEWVGYIASFFIALSLMMSSRTRLRWLNLAGSLLMSLYGFCIGSLPVLLVNIFIAATNIYYLVQLYRTSVNLKIVQSEQNSSYLNYFLDYYRKDIVATFPEFNFTIGKKDLLYFLIRNSTVTGVLILRPVGMRLLVRLDYVVVGYRDLKLAWYLYYTWSRHLQQYGFTHFIFRVSSSIHRVYLKKMGFRNNGKREGSEYELPVGLIRLNPDS